MEDELEETVRVVCSAAEKLEIEVVLVGALMARFSPEIGADYPKFRGTNDADFGVSVRDWEAFGKLHGELVARGFRADPKIEHRLHRGAAMADLIPYGARIAPEGKLTWPGSGFEMTVVGFEEVCAAANEAAQSSNSPLPVITVPGFVLLKIIAYLERKARQDPKHRDDARDIEYWLLNFASGADDARRFDLAGKPGFEPQEYETAGAALLGIEVSALASPEAAAYVDRFAKESEDLYSPFMDALAAGRFEEAADKKRRDGLALLAAFKKSLRLAP